VLYLADGRIAREERPERRVAAAELRW
jgi:hypothetical protein